MTEGDIEHEEELTRLLAELGETLGRRERLLEQMKRARTQARLHDITVEADQPFAGWDQEMLVDDLQRELERQRAYELELQRLLDLLERQRRIEDSIFRELDQYLAQEHRDELAKLWRELELRDALFEGIDSGTLQDKGKLVPDAMEHQREIEDRLYRLIERHLAHRHRP
jgi:hypothetical protein